MPNRSTSTRARRSSTRTSASTSGPVAPRRMRVDVARELALARARFAGDQHRRVARRHAAARARARPASARTPRELARRVDAREPRIAAARLSRREPALFPRAAHEHVDLRQAIRLRHVVVRAELHRGDRRLDRAVAGDDDAPRRRTDSRAPAAAPRGRRAPASRCRAARRRTAARAARRARRARRASP